MKRCPKCELNYIKDSENLCEVCKNNSIRNNNQIDDNKTNVEKNLLPILKRLSRESLEMLTHKDLSYEIFKIRLPLLKQCSNIDKEHCKKEVITDSSGTYRYYIKPYLINGEYYHICSQWADTYSEESKQILQSLRNKWDFVNK